MLAKVTHIIPVTTIQRERLLPVPGRVLARRGQKVIPSDVIAETDLAPEHVLVNVARALRISPKEVSSLLEFREGDDVAEGDVFAERSVGFGKLISRAPRTGQIVSIRNGQVLLEVSGHPFELRAGMSGEVVELVADYGAFIETTGALIQGVWGNGRFDVGVMSVLAESPDEVIVPGRLDVSMRGAVVLAGQCDDPNVISAASEVPLRGLILASMSSGVLPIASRARCPVLVLEGFGNLAMNEAAFKLLSTNSRRDVVVNAEMRHSRPEVIIPLPPTPDMLPLNDVNTFAPGQKVRLIRNPSMGKVGVITEILPGLTTLDNGIRVSAAVIQLDDQMVFTLPLANLEVLE